ncbi:IniB N-terminal domain-containing protein, partial [Micromonospora sp. NPDC005163]
MWWPWIPRGTLHGRIEVQLSERQSCLGAVGNRRFDDAVKFADRLLRLTNLGLSMGAFAQEPGNPLTPNAADALTRRDNAGVHPRCPIPLFNLRSIVGRVSLPGPRPKTPIDGTGNMSESASTNSTADVNSTSAADWTGNTEVTADANSTTSLESTANAGSTAEMGVTAGMASPQSLQDFVFGLLSNVDARAAYEADPQGALDGAGLNDVNPADVQDIVPLVADYVPVQGVTSLLAGDSLGVSAGATVDGLALGGVAGTLDSTLGGLGLTGVTGDVGATLDSVSLSSVTGALDNTLGGLGVSAVTGGLGGTAHGVTALAAGVIGDVGGTLDGTVGGLGASGVIVDVGGTLDGTVGGLGVGGVTGDLGGTVHGVTGLAGGVTGDLGGTLDGTVGGLGVGGVTGDLGGTVHGVTGLAGGVTG